MKPIWLAVPWLLVATSAFAIEPYAELRLYPAGGIASVGVWPPLDHQTEWGASLLYNRAERGDAGRHDHESGDGIGAGIEARRFQTATTAGWFYGVRAEIFKLDIDWRDAGGRRGRTDIVVLQPTARLGYRFAHSPFELSANLGAEINLETRGERVGEGAIALAGLAYRFTR